MVLGLNHQCFAYYDLHLPKCHMQREREIGRERERVWERDREREREWGREILIENGYRKNIGLHFRISISCNIKIIFSQYHKVFTFIVGIQFWHISVFQGLFLSFPILILSSSLSQSLPLLSLFLSFRFFPPFSFFPFKTIHPFHPPFIPWL